MSTIGRTAGLAMAVRRVIRGVVFDMDGTLTVPVLDFHEMRRKVGIPVGDILETLNSWPDDRRAAGYQAIWEVEKEALPRMQVMPGAIELCRYLDACSIPRGLITRNVTESVEYFHQNHFPLAPFDPALSREFTPAKPYPDSLLHICRMWGIAPHEAMIIGDSAKDDVACGNRAGAATVLFDSAGYYQGQQLEGEEQPDVRVQSLAEVGVLFSTHFDLVPQAEEEGLRDAARP